MSNDSSNPALSSDNVSEHEHHSPEGSPQPQKAAKSKRFWHPVVAIALAAAVFVGGQILASVPFVVYPAAEHWTSARTTLWIDSAYVQFAYVALVEALTVGGIWWFTRLGGRRLRDIGLRRFKLSAVGYALLGFVVYFVAYLILLIVSKLVVPELNTEQEQDIGFQNVVGAGQLFVTFLSLVVLPPIAEELFFRGFLFTSFRRHMGLVAAMLLTSVLFAVPHLLESAQPGSLLWVGGLDTFTLSLVLCFLREKTNSLWAGMLLHGLKNGIAFVSLFLVGVH